jgi:hypothetical protein
MTSEDIRAKAFLEGQRADQGGLAEELKHYLTCLDCGDASVVGVTYVLKLLEESSLVLDKELKQWL